MTTISTLGITGTPMEIAVEDSSKGAIPCGCGNLADVDLSNILTSYPPMYATYCRSCHARGYIYTSEYHGRIDDMKRQEEVSKEQATQDKLDALTRRIEELERQVVNLQKGLGQAQNDILFAPRF